MQGDKEKAGGKEMSKEDRKEIERLKKEKDKLEMQAMVLRMQERDKEKR